MESGTMKRADEEGEETGNARLLDSRNVDNLVESDKDTGSEDCPYIIMDVDDLAEDSKGHYSVTPVKNKNLKGTMNNENYNKKLMNKFDETLMDIDEIPEVRLVQEPEGSKLEENIPETEVLKDGDDSHGNTNIRKEKDIFDKTIIIAESEEQESGILIDVQEENSVCKQFSRECKIDGKIKVTHDVCKNENAFSSSKGEGSKMSDYKATEVSKTQKDHTIDMKLLQNKSKLSNPDERKSLISNVSDKVQNEELKSIVNEKNSSSQKTEGQSCLVNDDDEIFVLDDVKEKSRDGVKLPGKETSISNDTKSHKRAGKFGTRRNSSDIICIDIKADDDIGIINEGGAHKTQKQCCNLECESRETLFKAPVAVLTFFGLKYVKGKSQRVCKKCFEKAVVHQERMAYVLMEHKPLLKETFPIRKDIALIDDSDEEASEEELPLGEEILLDVDDKLMEVIDSSLENYDLDFQVKEADAILNATYETLKDEFNKTDEVFNEVQKEIDELRASLYRGFAPRLKEVPALEILDTPEYNHFPGRNIKTQSLSNIQVSPSKSWQSLTTNPESPRRSSIGVATKKVTQVQRPSIPGTSPLEMTSQQEVVALEQVQQVRPVLPPMGPLSRPKPNNHDVLYAMKNGYYGIWARAKLLEILSKPDVNNPSKMEYQYKIKYESRKSSMVKIVSGKQISYSQPSPVRLPVGTRVIALFRDEWAKECYYAGIIAEPPKSMNKYRYLVFFDDGYAQYVVHDKILLVCECSRNVWEDIHPDSRDFVRNYLEQYPERPMLKLQRGQIVKTEWNGKWWIARVMEVDGSLVKMHFDADGRTELIYRGSTRLGPLYSELANAAARKNLGSFSRHRSMGISSLKRRNMPYVEYTRSDLDENKLEDSAEITRSIEKATMPTRAVARKSTSRRTDSAREQLEALILSSDRDIQSGHVDTRYIDPTYKPRMFAPHQCGYRCIDGIIYDPTQIKCYNPLVLPQLHGWQRHITRCKAKKIVIYRSPCGRRLRNMEELHRYLRVTKSNLSVDLFDYDSWVHCFSEYVMSAGFINIKDLSYGSENVPVPCVNNVDHSKPEFVKYSTVRLPMEGVNVNTDPQFLVCCDCTDDCQNKEKCACWQLTIQGTAYASGGKVDTSVGYWYKRLREPVMTGIYECNARCKCASTCLNRVAQHPLQLRLQVFKTENRGWGIRCLNDVPHGAFICIYAGRLLTEQGANECVLVKGGKNYGDEYLAELDYIEVVERLKEGYESDVVEDDEDNIPFNSSKEEKKRKGVVSEEDEEEEGDNSHDAHDSDYEVDFRHHHLNVLPLEESTIRTRLRNRKARNSSIDSEGREREGGRENESHIPEKAMKKSEGDRKNSDDGSGFITLSDEEEDEQREREPSRFAAISGPKKETEKKVPCKSVREYFGDDELCYIMDAKNDGNIGRYLNHSCSPNVFVQNVFVDTHDLRFPWVAFFALTYISAGTELTWDYNYDVGSVPGKVLHCYCGSNDCRGRLL